MRFYVLVVHLFTCLFFFFFFNDTATTEIYTLSLHDALPICRRHLARWIERAARHPARRPARSARRRDRKSTRLNSSHLVISYAVFCLKKKKNYHYSPSIQTHQSEP